MKPSIKFLLGALFALVIAAVPAAAAPLSLTVSGAPLNASPFAAGATAVYTISLLSIDYQNGIYRFQLLDNTGTPYNAGAVYGVNVTQPSEANALADITAAIAAAH